MGLTKANIFLCPFYIHLFFYWIALKSSNWAHSRAFRFKSVPRKAPVRAFHCNPWRDSELGMFAFLMDHAVFK